MCYLLATVYHKFEILLSLFEIYRLYHSKKNIEYLMRFFYIQLFSGNIMEPLVDSNYLIVG